MFGEHKRHIARDASRLKRGFCDWRTVLGVKINRRAVEHIGSVVRGIRIGELFINFFLRQTFEVRFAIRFKRSQRDTSHLIDNACRREEFFASDFNCLDLKIGFARFADVFFDIGAVALSIGCFLQTFCNR